MTRTPATLTTTQYSALGDLRHRGALVASPHAFGPAGRTYSTRTLSALVDAGHARWDTVRGVPGAPAVTSGIVPIDGSLDAPSTYPPDMVHAALPDGEGGHCHVCGQAVRPVAGGKYVHPDGCVAARTPAAVILARLLVADWRQRVSEPAPDRPDTHENDPDEEIDDIVAGTYADVAGQLEGALTDPIA